MIEHRLRHETRLSENQFEFMHEYQQLKLFSVLAIDGKKEEKKERSSHGLYYLRKDI